MLLIKWRSEVLKEYFSTEFSKGNWKEAYKSPKRFLLLVIIKMTGSFVKVQLLKYHLIFFFSLIGSSVYFLMNCLKSRIFMIWCYFQLMFFFLLYLFSIIVFEYCISIAYKTVTLFSRKGKSFIKSNIWILNKKSLCRFESLG